MPLLRKMYMIFPYAFLGVYNSKLYMLGVKNHIYFLSLKNLSERANQDGNVGGP